MAHRRLGGPARRARPPTASAPRQARRRLARADDWLSGTVQLYGRHFRLFVVIALVVQLPLAIPAPLAWLDGDDPAIPAALWYLPYGAYLVSMGLGLGAIAYVTWRLSSHHVVTLRDVSARVLALFWPLCRLAVLLLALAMGIFVLLIPLLLVISGRLDELNWGLATSAKSDAPTAAQLLHALVSQLGTLTIGALLLTPGSLALPALVVEANPSAVAAIKRSLTLVKPAWWRVGVGVATLLAVTYLLPVTLMTLMAALTVRIPGSTPGRLFEYTSPLPGITWLVAEVLLWPLAGIGLTRLYFERVSRVSR